jgi:hypothetical protein
LITTRTIYQSFLRKYAALSGFDEDFLKRVLNFRQVRINDPTSIRGATFRFFYSLHSIPCIGFEVVYGTKRIVFSGDHLNDVERIQALKDEGVLSQERYVQFLCAAESHTHAHACVCVISHIRIMIMYGSIGAMNSYHFHGTVMSSFMRQVCRRFIHRSRRFLV